MGAPPPRVPQQAAATLLAVHAPHLTTVIIHSLCHCAKLEAELLAAISDAHEALAAQQQPQQQDAPAAARDDAAAVEPTGATAQEDAAGLPAEEKQQQIGPIGPAAPPAVAGADLARGSLKRPRPAGGEQGIGGRADTKNHLIHPRSK